MIMGVFVKNNEQIQYPKELGYEEGKERRLENLIIDNPEIFPVEQISTNSRKWIPVAKQISLVTGRTDTIGIDDEGGIYIIENKLDANNDKKTVRQQSRDYAHAFRQLRERKDGWEKFLKLIEHANNSASGDITGRSFSNKDLKTILHEKLESEKAEECLEDLRRNFEKGFYTLVVAIDKIPKPLRISIDGENSIDGNTLPMFALEVKEWEINSNERIIVTNTYPYDLDEIKRKMSSPRGERNDKEIFDEQFEKSDLTSDQRVIFKKFYYNLGDLANDMVFNQGKSAKVLPRFDILENRSPINLYAKGKLKLQFQMLWQHEELRDDFKSQLMTIPDIMKIIDKKVQDSYGIPPEAWLPHSEQILRIIKQVFSNK
jgi:hypothetical protein